MFIDRVSTRTRTRPRTGRIPIPIPLPVHPITFPIRCEILLIRFVCSIKHFAHAAKAFITLASPLSSPPPCRPACCWRQSRELGWQTHTLTHAPNELTAMACSWHSQLRERSAKSGVTGLRNCLRCTTWRMRNVSPRFSLARSLFLSRASAFPLRQQKNSPLALAPFNWQQQQQQLPKKSQL